MRLGSRIVAALADRRVRTLGRGDNSVGSVSVETDRLLLRTLAMTDAGRMLALHQSEDMQRYFGDGHVYTPEESRTWLEWHVALGDLEGFSFLAATLKSNLSLVGWVGLNRVMDDPELKGETEIGWFIDRRFWGQGLATEGELASLSFGFDSLGLDRIIARYRTDNVASGRVMEKVGMRLWTTIPNPEVEGTTVTLYEMDADDWPTA
jgi:ribosomal-protein-alanine N-acetyltransferase